MKGPRQRTSPATRRRALELLAGSIDGCTEEIMRAYGFTEELMIELVRAGLATAHTERMVAGGRPLEVTRMRIDVYRRAIFVVDQFDPVPTANPKPLTATANRLILARDEHYKCYPVGFAD